MSNPIRILVAAVASCMLCSQAARAATSAAADTVTVVLVHGAFAESSSWDRVIPKLTARGFRVVAVANPLRGLAADSDYVATVLGTIDGPVVLVGHSYGGSVITNAARGHGSVRALVYVDGTAPDTGETTAGLAAKFPGGTLGPALAPPVRLPAGGTDLYIRPDRYWPQFAGDVPEAQAAVMAATQRPVTEAALNDPSGPPAWRGIPSWFIYGELDRNIPPAAHLFMARRAGAKEVVEVKTGSHVVMVSHPDEVALVIEHAARSTLIPFPTVRPTPSSEPLRTAPPTPPTAFAPAPVVPLPTQAPAQLIVDAPLPEQLARGYVVIRYRAVNVRILPVYGPAAAGVSPRIGHLHVTVDDLPWHWLDASGEPLSINGLPAGPHKIFIELESPTHQVIGSRSVPFVIPKK